MARVTKTSATGTASKINKLIVEAELGFVMLDRVSIKKNINGKEYVAIPGHGATYMGVDKIQPNVVYKVVQFAPNDDTTSGTGSLALNDTSVIEKMQFYSKLFPSASLTEIKELFGL
jgi:hypothetical protein